MQRRAFSSSSLFSSSRELRRIRHLSVRKEEEQQENDRKRRRNERFVTFTPRETTAQSRGVWGKHQRVQEGKSSQNALPQVAAQIETIPRSDVATFRVPQSRRAIQTTPTRDRESEDIDLEERGDETVEEDGAGAAGRPGRLQALSRARVRRERADGTRDAEV